MKSDTDYQRFNDGNAVASSGGGGSMKLVAFMSVVFSTVAVSACFLCIPLMFEHVQRLQARVRYEVNVCQTDTLNLWRELAVVSPTSTPPDFNRPRAARAQGGSAACLLDVIFVVDVTGSVNVEFARHKAHLLKFINYPPVADYASGRIDISIIQFNTQGTLVTPLSQVTKDQAIADANKLTNSGGGTSSLSGMRIAQQQMTKRRPGSDLVVVLITDGNSIDPLDGPGSIKETGQAMRDAGAKIYVITYSNDSYTPELQRYAGPGQKIWHPQDIDSLTNAEMDVFMHVNNPACAGPATPTTPTTPQIQTNVDAGCCSCQQGPSGPAGAPGADGKPGAPGTDGGPGAPGEDAGLHDKLLPAPEQCPCESSPGPNGPPGERGQPGQNGRDGNPGSDGRNGEPGKAGPAGQPGPGGKDGDNGKAGPPGSVKDGPGSGEKGKPGPAGPAGPPGPGGPPGNAGKNGDNGAPGAPGNNGQPGPPGKNGDSGAKGPDGDKGPKGTCDKCPQPRLAPGY